MSRMFVPPTPKEEQLARARRVALIRTITELDHYDVKVWIFCVWCGHADMTEPRWLIAQVKDPSNLIEELEQRLRCQKCRRFGARIIPTDRTHASFDRMGASRRDGT